MKIDGDTRDTGLGPGVIAVEKHLCEPFSTFEEKAARTQKDIEDVLVELGWNDQEA